MSRRLTKLPSVCARYLQCPVCMDVLREPRALPCMHTFCTRCLHAHITSVCPKGTELGFDCAVCRRYTKPSENSLHPTFWAENFPMNLTAYGIIEDIRQKSYSDQSPEADITTGPSLPATPCRLCDAHADRAIEFFCEDHQRYICSVCAAIEHRKCDSVQFLELSYHSASKSQKKWSRSTQNGTSTIMTATSKHDTSTQLPNAYITKAYTSCLDSESQMSEPQHRQVVRNHSTGAGPNADVIAKDFARARFIGIQTGESELNDTSQDVEPESGLGSTSIHREMFSKKSLTRLCGTKVPAQKQVQSEAPVHLTDTPVSRLSPGDEPLPNFHVGKLRPDPGNLNDIIEEDEDLIVTSIETNFTSQLQLTTEIYVRSQRDKRICSVSALAFVSPDKILIADEGNSNVKLFTEDGHLISSLTLQSEPWDVAILGDDAAVVSCPTTKHVNFIIFNELLSLQKSIEFEKKCYGLACANEEIFVAMEDEVKIIDYEGKTIRRITHDTSRKRFLNFSLQRQLFRGAKYLCFDIHTDLLHVSDVIKSCVTSIDRMGGMASKLRFPREEAPRCVSLGLNGQLYVCQMPDQLLNVTIGPHGNHIRSMLRLDNLQCTTTLPGARSLWVARKANNFVRVYALRADC